MDHKQIRQTIKCLDALNRLGAFKDDSALGEVGTILVNRLRALCDLPPRLRQAQTFADIEWEMRVAPDYQGIDAA